MRIFCILVILLSANISNAQNPGWKPDSLKKYTILVMKAEKGIMQNKYNKELDKAFSKYYTGPFELVGQKDLEDSKYADLTKYRYTVNYFQTGKIVKKEPLGNSNHMVERETPILDVFFHDRSNNKDLNRPGIQATTYIDAMRQLGKMLEQNTKQ